MPLKPHGTGMPRAALIGALAACVLVAAAPAQALKLKPAVVTVDVAAHQGTTQTASCPGQSRLVSGGFHTSSIDFVDFSETTILPWASFPAGPRELTAGGRNFGGESGPFSTTAFCAKKDLRTKIRFDDSAPIPDPGLGGAVAKCKQSETAISGGFEVLDYDPEGSGDSPVVYESFRVGQRRWQASALNEFGTSYVLRSYALCSKRIEKLKTRSAETTIEPGSASNAEASCRHKETALSDGFQATAELDNATVPFQSGPTSARSWSVVAAPQGETAGSLRADVYCLG